MKICFVCFTDWNFSVDTPHLRPLGGSHSALSYLAEELARLGHHVTLVTNTDRPGLRRGVHCRALAVTPMETLRACDAVIVLNETSFQILRAVRRGAGPRPLLVLWMHHRVVQFSLLLLNCYSFQYVTAMGRMRLRD
jgi:hypothetical protein